MSDDDNCGGGRGYISRGRASLTRLVRTPENSRNVSAVVTDSVNTNNGNQRRPTRFQGGQGGYRGSFGGRGVYLRSQDDDNDNDDRELEQPIGRGGFQGRGGRGAYQSSQIDDDGGLSGQPRGRGGFQGRGGRGAYQSSQDDDNDNDDRELERPIGRGGFQGRGGRGAYQSSQNDDDGGLSGQPRGRGGFQGRGGRGANQRSQYTDATDEGNGGQAEEKPREVYIPPEPTDDEAVLFSSGTTAGENFTKFENIPYEVTGENPVQSISTFEECGLKEFVLVNVRKSGYSIPTPIQKHSIPIIMAKRDIMACAQTGSGKTAAFLVPIINALLDEPAELVIGTTVEPQAIILSPTRELGLQIFNEARKFSYQSILKIKIIYGGTSAIHQGTTLSNGCHILVATPGRLIDFLTRGRLAFSSVRFFVLDEADRMLDMGFKPLIEQMLTHQSMPPAGTRQTIMFSATFPNDIQSLAANYLKDSLFVTIGKVGSACTDVEQKVFEVTQFKKREKLVEIIRENEAEMTLIFVKQKRNVDFLAAYLSDNKLPSTSIHGDRYQSQREQALADFRSGRMPRLIATNVASRGLDIKNVAHVINYDLPMEIDEYVHRIGRTGRVGNRGKATSFYDPEKDREIARELARVLEEAGQEVPSFLAGASCGGSDNVDLHADITMGEPQPGADQPDEEW